MSDSDLRRLNICLLTDVFPPRCGGSGWSTYYLGKALAERGHYVRVLRARYDEPVRRPARRVVRYGGLSVEELLVPAPPWWAALVGAGRAWSEDMGRRLLAMRAARLAAQGEADVLHGQHSVSGVASSLAALRARRQGVKVASVATVRDYWPLCPVSTRLFTDRQGQMFECRDCHRLMTYLACARQSTRRRWWKTTSVIPACLRWWRTRRAASALARCDAVVAVSSYVRGELERSGRVPPGKLYTIPNLVDPASVRRALEGVWPLPDIAPGEPFLLYVGKLDANKGVHILPGAVARAGVDLPVVVVGEGPVETELKRAARRRGLDFRFYSWLDNDAVLLLMRHARALLFPSAWQEPLSRVLVESCAVGAAIVALNTGGTGDLIGHMHSGWLADDADSFVEGIRQVVGDAGLNARLREGARRVAEERLTAPVVCARMEQLYLAVLNEVACP